jgi:hypothetical protein
MQQVASEIVMPYGIPVGDAYALVQQAWQPPDPVREAVPLVDVLALFSAIRARGAQIAVATADNLCADISYPCASRCRSFGRRCRMCR